MGEPGKMGEPGGEAVGDVEYTASAANVALRSGMARKPRQKKPHTRFVRFVGVGMVMEPTELDRDESL